MNTRRVRLTHKPSGVILPQDFMIEEISLDPLGPGQVLLRNLYLSMDPYLAKSMREWQGPDPAWTQGIVAGRTIAQVIATRSEKFAEGDIVLSHGRWQNLDIRAEGHLRHLPSGTAPVSAHLGVLGASGLTAWVALNRILKIEAGHILTISAAAGTVGAIAGQMAKIRGCRVVGIAGGSEKCRFVVDELGFDECVDYKQSEFEAKFAAALPVGVDRHLENVGSSMLDAVLGLAKDRGVIALCGLIAHYQDQNPITLRRFREFLYKSIALLPFRTADFPEVFDEARTQLQSWLADGRLRLNETISEGIDQAPRAYCAMLRGEGMGKHLVKLSQSGL